MIKMYIALKVISETAHIKRYLKEVDPKALEQVQEAIEHYELANGIPSEVVQDKRYLLALKQVQEAIEHWERLQEEYELANGISSEGVQDKRI